MDLVHMEGLICAMCYTVFCSSFTIWISELPNVPPCHTYLLTVTVTARHVAQNVLLATSKAPCVNMFIVQLKTHPITRNALSVGSSVTFFTPI